MSLVVVEWGKDGKQRGPCSHLADRLFHCLTDTEIISEKQHSARSQEMRLGHQVIFSPSNPSQCNVSGGCQMSHPPKLLTFLLATLTVARKRRLAVTTVTQGTKATHHTTPTCQGRGEMLTLPLPIASQLRKASAQATEIPAV